MGFKKMEMNSAETRYESFLFACSCWIMHFLGFKKSFSESILYNFQFQSACSFGLESPV